MNCYENFEHSGRSFEERVGQPQASAAGIGHVVMSFNCLCLAIWKALNTIKSVAPFVHEAEPQAFELREGVELLSAAVRMLSPVVRFNGRTDDAIECWKTIAAQCFRSEELCEEVMLFNGSELVWDPSNGVEALQPSSPREWDGARLLDIADYVATVATYVDDFFLVVEVRNTPASFQQRAARGRRSIGIRGHPTR